MTQENKMGTMPVNRLLVTMSLPMVISMLVQAMYNIVDSIFVSMISQSALTAVSMAFPVQNLIIAVSAGTCVGVNALPLAGRAQPEKCRLSGRQRRIFGLPGLRGLRPVRPVRLPSLL